MHNMRCRQPDGAGRGLRLPRCLKLQGLGGLLHIAQVGQQGLHEIGGAEAAGMAVEEQSAQSGLRCADLSTEGWLA
jgi:hypothetical protein